MAKFKVGDLCLTQNMVNPAENGLYAEVTGVGMDMKGENYKDYSGFVQPYNAHRYNCMYEVYIPYLQNIYSLQSDKYGLFDIPEFRLRKLPDDYDERGLSKFEWKPNLDKIKDKEEA